MLEAKLFHKQLEDANCVEDILCYATLVAVGELKGTRHTVLDAQEWYDKNIETPGLDCSSCDFHNRCLAFHINE